MPPSSATSTAPNSPPSMKKSAHPLEWTVEQVVEWLRSHGSQWLTATLIEELQAASITSLLNPGAHSQKFAEWVRGQGSKGSLIANAIEDLHRLASITSLPNSVAHTQNIAGLSQDEDDDLLSYLPEMVAGVETDISTEPIRKDLGLESHPRQLLVIVFVELDGIIKKLKGDEYWQVLWDCIRCHKRLWKLGIHHRDISNGNLMYYRKNGHLFGVLIDFDLACLEGMPSENQRRTGTRPFMASDLLLGEGPFEHLYKHDAESFFWVAVYDSALDSSLVRQWGNFDNTTLCSQKSFYIIHGTTVIPMDGKWGNPRPIRHWLDNMRRFNSRILSMDLQGKDWGVDELYNTLRSFLEDGGAALSGHIKTRQAKYAAEST